MIFLLQHLGFVINLKKCVLNPAQEIEFLGLIANSQAITLSLPEEKIREINDQCLRLYKPSEASLLDLTKLIGIPFVQPYKQCPQPVYSFASYNSKFYL